MSTIISATETNTQAQADINHVPRSETHKKFKAKCKVCGNPYPKTSRKHPHNGTNLCPNCRKNPHNRTSSLFTNLYTRFALDAAFTCNSTNPNTNPLTTQTFTIPE